MILHGTDPQSLFSMTGRQSAIHAHGYWASERSSTDKRVSLVRKQPVHTDSSSRGDVDFAVGHGWGYEFHGIARCVSRALRAVPELLGEVHRVVGVENRGATSWRLLSAILTAVDRPDDAVRGAGGRDGRRSAWEPIPAGRL